MSEKNGNFDVVITGGRVIDPETKLDAVRNVGIKGGKIAAVTEEPIAGKETIDATGHVVCPGFIDMHHHNTGVPFGEKLALRDGITTPMELEGGVYPVEEWYGSLEGKCRANYGASVGIVPIREHLFNPGYKTAFAGDWIYDMTGGGMTMKWSQQMPTAEQMDTWSMAARRQSPSPSRSSPESTGRRHSSTPDSRARCLPRAASSDSWR
jgi:hypothetical protein